MTCIKTESTASVYVGTYGKYNNGSIAGAWLDLEDFADKEAFYEAIGISDAIDDIDQALDQARDAFAGVADSPADFAGNLAEECGAVPADFPAWISIDWEATWSCNLRHDYVSEYHNGQYWFFSC